MVGTDQSGRNSSTRDKTVLMAAIVVVCILVRVLLFRKFGAVTQWDTSSFLRLANQIRAGDLSHDTGQRVPIWSLIYALSGLNPSRMVAIQIALSMGAILLLFDASQLLLKNTKAAAMVACAYGIWPAYARYDITLLSESLATTFTITCIWACIRFLETRKISWLLLAGTMASVAGLTRPVLLMLAIVIPIWSFAVLHGNRTTQIRALGLAILPVIVLVGSWCAFNKSRFGTFNVSTVGGIALTDITIDMLADYPKGQNPEVDAIVAASLPRTEENRGWHVQAVWKALPEMERSSGKTFAQISQELMPINIWAIKSHPVDFASVLSASMTQFWTPAGIGSYDIKAVSKQLVGNAGMAALLAKIYDLITRIMALVLWGFIIAAPLSLTGRLMLVPIRNKWFVGTVLCLSIAMLICPYGFVEACTEIFALLFTIGAPIVLLVTFRERGRNIIWLIVAFAWTLSIISCSADFANPRYGAPLAPWVFLTVGLCLAERLRIGSPSQEAVSAIAKK